MTVTDAENKRPPWLSIIIPTLNAQDGFEACLDALSAAGAEIIVVDGGSTDETQSTASAAGAHVFETPPGRGGQLRCGAEKASSDWLLFLHADTVLQRGWRHDVERFTRNSRNRAGVFTLAFDSEALPAKIVAFGAMARTRLFKNPYGDQGLVISKKVYQTLGGYADMPLFEDVDMMRRIVKRYGRGSLHVFSTRAVTSARRYERAGYFRQVAANAWRLARYYAGVSPERLRRSYR